MPPGEGVESREEGCRRVALFLFPDGHSLSVSRRCGFDQPQSGSPRYRILPTRRCSHVCSSCQGTKGEDGFAGHPGTCF